MWAGGHHDRVETGAARYLGRIRRNTQGHDFGLARPELDPRVGRVGELNHQVLAAETAGDGLGSEEPASEEKGRQFPRSRWILECYYTQPHVAEVGFPAIFPVSTMESAKPGPRRAGRRRSLIRYR